MPINKMVVEKKINSGSEAVMEMLGRIDTIGLIETVSSRTSALSSPAPEPARPTSTDLLFNREQTGVQKVYL